MKIPAPPLTVHANVHSTAPRKKTPPTALRRRYVSPLEKKVGATLGKSDLQFFGRCLLKYIRQEAMKDAAKTGQVPTTKDFYDSFSYKIKENSIEVSSTWPWIELITSGTDGPYAMKWLTQARGVYKVPLKGKDGQILIRSTPLTTDKAWIHPGIAAHTFIQRAFRRATKDCLTQFLNRNVNRILNKALGG